MRVALNLRLSECNDDKSHFPLQPPVIALIATAFLLPLFTLVGKLAVLRKIKAEVAVVALDQLRVFLWPEPFRFRLLQHLSPETYGQLIRL